MPRKYARKVLLVEVACSEHCLLGHICRKASKVCLFELMLYIPVNTYGHVGTLPPFYVTFTPKSGCHDIQTSASNITTQVRLDGLYV